MLPVQAMNICRSYSYKPQDSVSLCAGKRLAKDRVRLKRNHRLECTSRSDSYIRRPQKMAYDTYKKWTNNEAYADARAQDDMQDILIEAFPDIKWEGRIPYQVVETWQWEECVYGQDLACGTYECNCTRDKNGYETCSTCIESCWHDVTRTETEFCSNETLTYDAKYERPDYNVWKAGAPGYYDVIPNKYDLLPGEVEVVQSFSNSSMRPRLAPKVEIGDAWNKYSINLKIDGGAPSVACTQNADHHLSVSINTIERKIGKKTPNAFRLPIAVDGVQMPVMEFLADRDSSGSTVLEAKPSMIRLMDVGGVLIESMARQSRTFEAAREQMKMENNQLASMSHEEAVEQENDSGFWEDTQVRIRLRKVLFGRDRMVTEDMITTEIDTKNLNDRLNSYDAKESVRFTELYEIDLLGDTRKSDAYHMSSSLPVNLYGASSYELTPGRKYVYEVSMYRKGVPFYLQEGGTNPDAAFYCGMFDCEANDPFSKPLELNFKAPKGVDQRGLLQRVNDFLGDKDL